MELSELTELIKSRRSIRRWQNKKVPEELLMQAIELATWAPNGSNMQNWRFFLILSPEKIKAISDATQEKDNYIASWPETKNLGIEDGIRTRSSYFRNAPAAIAVAAGPLEVGTDKLLAAREKTDPVAAQIYRGRQIADSRVQTVASFITTLLLIFHQMGLGAAWMVSPMQAKIEIEKILKVLAGYDLVALIPVGYPAESPAPRARKPVKEVCEIIR